MSALSLRQLGRRSLRGWLLATALMGVAGCDPSTSDEAQRIAAEQAELTAQEAALTEQAQRDRTATEATRAADDARLTALAAAQTAAAAAEAAAEAARAAAEAEEARLAAELEAETGRPGARRGAQAPSPSGRDTDVSDDLDE